MQKEEQRIDNRAGGSIRVENNRNEILKKIEENADSSLLMVNDTFNSKETVVKTSKRGKIARVIIKKEQV